MIEILSILPENLVSKIIYRADLEKITEIRLRNEKNVIIYEDKKEYILDYTMNIMEFMDILNKISKNSIYAIEKELKQGYITVAGGHRIGICGETVFESGKVISIKNISSMNIRVAREKIGISNKIMRYIIKER